MLNQTKLKISRLLRVRYLFFLIFLTYFQNSVSSHEFCGYSLTTKSEEDLISFRNKRSIDGYFYTEAQRQSIQSLEPQISVNQQEDQIVIDETSFGRIKHEESPQNSDTRIECSRSTSRFSGQALDDSGSRRIDDCNLKTIETAVFIDQALENKFSGQSNGLKELNKLVLTIMNQVQNLFSYSSMKVPIRIKLVLVEHLRDGERSGLSMPNSEKGDIDLYLSNFCNWQHNRLERDKRLWWDHAILLSG